MSEFFRSALGYFSGTSGEEHDFVGQTVDLGGGNKLKIKKVIAEGGYGFVFIAQDGRSNKLYALKRQIVVKEQVELIKKEISFLKILSGHNNIIQFVAAAGVPASKTSHGSAEFLIQTELCTGGQLLEVVANIHLTPRQVLRVFYETCSAVAHMHNQIPPIIHRDLKVENLLLSAQGEIKLCDFGSATISRVQPDDNWTQSQRGLVEEELQRNTTPMYRAPEMVDLYNNYPIDERTDIWALGCLLYKLCYTIHPFEDASKLSIINANYKIPEDDATYSIFHPLMRACLVVDPCKRPPVNEILAHLYSVAQQLGEDLSSEPTEPLPLSVPQGEGEWLEHTAQQAHKLFGMMKGGAENLFKNIKDTSSKVMYTVAGKRSVLDISYITSKILVMSLPSEDPLQGHNLDEVRTFLDTRHTEQYLVFNLSDQSYDASKLHNQVADFDWPAKRMLDLEKLIDLCTSIDSWLRADVNNVVVVHCSDGQLLSATTVVAYLVFIGLFAAPLTGYKLFNLKRNQSETSSSRHGNINPLASHLRYVQCISDMVREDDGCYGNGIKPHPHPLTVYSIRLTTVPVFNMHRSGCKPFVEVFQNGKRVFTSIGQEEMDKLQSYTAEDGEIVIPIGVSVCGNVVIVVHHIRAIPIVKMSGRGMSAVRMFQLQFHTGVVQSDWTEVMFSRSDLDGSTILNENKFPSPFKVIMSVGVDASRQGLSAERCASWENLPHPQDTPLTCFASIEEQQSVLKEFAEFDKRATYHYKQKQQQQSQSHSRLHSPPYSSAQPQSSTSHSNDQHLFTEPMTTAYIPYHDHDEMSPSSSDDDSDSDANVLSTDNPVNSQPAQFGTLLNLDSPPAGTSTTAVGSTRAAQPGDDLAAVFSNPSVDVKTANLLDVSFENPTVSKSSNHTTPAPPPTSSNHTASTPPSRMGLGNSSSIEDLLFGREERKSTPLSPQQKPLSASSGNLMMGGWDTTPAQQHQNPTIFTQPTVIGNTGAQFGTNAPTMANTQYNNNAMGKSMSQGANLTTSTSKSSNDMFAQFVTLQAGSMPSSQNSTPGTSPWPGTSPHPGGSPHQGASPRSGGSPVPPTNNMYWPGSGYQSQMGSHLSQQNKTRHQTAPAMSGTPSGGGAKKPSSKPQPSTGYTSVIAGREDRGVRRPLNPTGLKPRLNVDDFQDLLGAEGFNVPSKDKHPQTLDDLKDKGDLDNETDPDKVKVMSWCKGKEKNLRALLSSLHLILWEGETRWKEIGMHQLVQPDQVRKYYKKACLVAHPDKLQAIGSPHENLARHIFIALNEAHTIFEESGGQPLF